MEREQLGELATTLLSFKHMYTHAHTHACTRAPSSPPHLKLEQPQGLTEDEVKDLTKEIRALARERVGEVMMLEIAQHVQVYIHN